MPLITITGTPCSGKTHRARQILQEFESRIKTTAGETKLSVVCIPSHHASLDPPAGDSKAYQCPQQSENPRDQIYDLARLEKTARAEEFSAIKRVVDQNTIVIADAPNYIKGFRYQLFCEAKAAGTRSVVVHTAASEDECRTWNNARLSTWQWQTDEAEQSEQNSAMPSDTGSRAGKDILGELEPESHTAIYGDRAAFNRSRSRSSSLGNANSDDEDDPAQRKHQTDDTMTLKSLYITDKSTPTSTALQASFENTTPHETQAPPDSSAHSTLPPTAPPPPNASLPYSPKTFKSLFMRHEPPSPFARWDTPLFTIPSTDPHPPYAEIWTALFPTPPKPTSKKALSQQQQREQNGPPSSNTLTDLPSQDPHPADNAEAQAQAKIKPHAATVLPAASAPNALQILESTTGEVAKLVLAAARAAGAADGDGGEITISLLTLTPESASELEPELELELSILEGVILSQPALQRLRRKYTQIQKGGIAHGQGHARGKRNVAEGFVRFLEAEWGVL